MPPFEVTFALLFGCLNLVHGYSIGPPVRSCATMEPRHRHAIAQTSATPYTVSVSKKSYNPAEKLTVTINTSGSNKSYTGIFVQARHSDCGHAVGSWTSPSGYFKLICCNGAASSGLGQSSKAVKTLPQRFIWTAPAAASTQVQFYVTVLQNFDTFWVKIPSASVESNRTSTKRSSKAKPSASATSSSSKVVFSIHICVIIMSLICLIV